MKSGGAASRCSEAKADHACALQARIERYKSGLKGPAAGELPEAKTEKNAAAAEP